MKKSNATFLSCTLFLMFFLTVLSAQQTDAQSKDEIFIIQKASTHEGVTEVDKKSLQKGEPFKTYLNQLNIENMEGKAVKIEVFNSELDQLKSGDSNEEETIFMYRSAKSDNVEKESPEKLHITLNNQLDEKRKTIKPLLGVFATDVENGVKVTRLVTESGAQKAGILEGDVITKINQQPVNNNLVLREIISQYKVGETIDIEILRNETPIKIKATLGEKNTNDSATQIRKHGHYYNFENQRAATEARFQNRNPCKAFIGVYTSSSQNGLIVHSIIPNTAAERSEIQIGDKIMAIDDVEVKSHRALVMQRDLHEAGDFFTLSILRNGEQLEVDAQFDACPEVEESTSQIEELPVEENLNPELDEVQNTLELESFIAFPNPTYGPVNLSFRGAAVPTTIRMTDLTGKLIYEEVINNFDGVYEGALNYSKAVPGALILSIHQEQKTYSQSLILLPKA